MNEFDALQMAIDIAVKHGRHNQKLHGRRFGPDTGGGSGGVASISSPVDELTFSDFAAFYRNQRRTSARLTLAGYERKIEAAKKAWMDYERKILVTKNDGELRQLRSKQARISLHEKDLIEHRDALKAALNDLENTRTPGWPSTEVAWEARSIRTPFLDRLKAVQAEVESLRAERKILFEKAKSAMSEANEARDRFLGADKNGPEYETLKKEFFKKSSAFSDAEAAVIAADNKIKDAYSKFEPISKEILANIEKNVRAKSAGDYKLNITVDNDVLPEIAAEAQKMSGRLQSVLDSRLSGEVHVNSNASLLGLDSNAAGAYDKITKSIFINPLTKDVEIESDRPGPVFAHELGHSFEDNRAVFSQAFSFRERRSPDEIPGPIKGYEGTEIEGYNDKHQDTYAGRIYFGQSTTEIISVYISRMMTNAAEFAVQDPGAFDFTYSIMRGDF